MRIKLVCVGRTKSEPLRTLIEDYTQRLAKFVRCEVIEVREGTAKSDDVVKAEEAERVLRVLRPDARVMVLDSEGRQMSSHELAGQVGRWQNASVKEAAFVVGGHLGVTSAVRERADLLWSLSRLTLTHEMARLLLVEQLYRAYTITRGMPYQK